ncbi:methyltransferase, FxLD system [Saccharothrix xinjiangensis]|uniref:Protein-L-isoaspartate O-methyltransferase n=1 Tax=Saccharothrix xinjiangensis TaxID=204798 RepID=A0ABV9XZH5_9PSEU
MTGTTPGERATELRNRTVDVLKEAGTVVSVRVEEVMRAVPRETFAPEADLDAVYEPWNGLVTKRDENGRPVSSLSAPDAQAHMLEQARIEPGMNVLEIGSGGMNAAYLAEMVGPTGRVTTVDIDEFVTQRTSQFLKQAGYPQVNVVLADAEYGVPEHAPYDRILVTVGAWDVPPAWIDQLVDGGLLVVPLKVMGLMRTVALVREGDRLVSESARLFGFVPMQGAGAHDSAELVLREGVRLVFDEQAPDEVSRLDGVLEFEPVVVDSGAGLRIGEPWATMQMWLATTVPGFCRIMVDRTANEASPRPLAGIHTGMAAVDGANLAYVASRKLGGKDLTLEVHAYGPSPAALAEVVAETLRIWDRDHRGGPGPQYLVYPTTTPVEQLPAADFALGKRHSRVLISWPRPANAVRHDVLHHPNHQ